VSITKTLLLVTAASTLLFILFGTAISAFGQDIETTCQTTFGTTQCTSKTVDNRTQGQINADALKAGWERGNQIRAQRAEVAAQRAFVNSVNTYCTIHQGQDWQLNGQTGHCQTDDERMASMYLNIESRHHEFNAKDPVNMKTICDYMEANNYDANSWKGWERAYKELKKQGRLHLFAKGSY
jgi:hypothetical protein